MIKQKDEKYIYRKHIHWLKLIKGRSKQPNSIRKFITSLIMSPLKEIRFFDEQPYNKILTWSLALNLKKEELILISLSNNSNL